MLGQRSHRNRNFSHGNHHAHTQSVFGVRFFCYLKETYLAIPADANGGRALVGSAIVCGYLGHVI